MIQTMIETIMENWINGNLIDARMQLAKLRRDRAAYVAVRIYEELPDDLRVSWIRFLKRSV